MDQKLIFEQWRDKLVAAVENICEKCTDPLKQELPTCPDKPLHRDCLCPRVDTILTQVDAINTDLDRLQAEDDDSS